MPENQTPNNQQKSESRVSDWLLLMSVIDDIVGVWIGFHKDGMNWYAYVGNDPMSKNDPTGNLGQAVAGCAAGAMGGPVGCAVGAITLSVITYYAAKNAIEITAEYIQQNSSSENESGEQNEGSGWRYDEETDTMIPPPEDPNDNDDRGEGRNSQNSSSKKSNGNQKRNNESAEHTKNARPSKKEQHENGRARLERDQGKEKKDPKMPYKRK